MGQLLGGAIAARFAIDHGDRLGRLVLVDTFGLTPFQPAPEFGLALHAVPGASRPGRHARPSLAPLCIRSGRLRQRMGERWEPFKAYNLDRARTPSVQAALAA